jgi:hypothetical protein
MMIFATRKMKVNFRKAEIFIFILPQANHHSAQADHHSAQADHHSAQADHHSRVA